MGEYRARIVDGILERKLRSIGAVLVVGPKQCGKTTSSELASKSVIYMTDPSEMERNIELAKIQPQILLKGETPRLIDEWQVAPKLWDAVRFEVDQRGASGQFILTGSSVPADRNSFFHSGTGRVALVNMRTMSLFESGDSNGAVSLRALFEDEEIIFEKNPINDLEKIAFLACRGGWPSTLDLDSDVSTEHASNYLQMVINDDISRVDGVKRNSDRAERLLRSYARFQGSQASYEMIRKDMLTNDSDSLSVDTVISYVNALKKIFIVEDLTAWNPNIRSKTAIRTSDTRYFTDPSIATAVMGIGAGALLGDLNTFGFVFETMCIRDLRVYADALNGKVYHYRDKTGLECDAVINLRDGRYGLIEIKLGGYENIEHGATTLKMLRNTIDTKKMKEPSFMMVLTGAGEFSYRRDDGVFVVPIGCLKD